MKAEFQRIARRDKKVFFRNQHKQIEENNRMGKTRDLFKKIRDTKGTFHASEVKSLSRVQLFATPWTIACQAPLSMGFSCISFSNPNPGIEPGSLALQADALSSEPPGKPLLAFHAKMGSIKGRNGMDLTEAEDIKKRWEEYTEELHKKDLHNPDDHNGLITHLDRARHPRL